MSAYLCKRHHIAYLAQIAASGDGAAWIAHLLGSEDGKLHSLSLAVAVAKELSNANAESLRARYPDTVKDSSRMPGDQSILEPWTISEMRNMHWYHIDLVQVIKACQCFEYQACEYKGWEESKARRIIDSIKSHAMHKLPGYDAAEWGAPAPHAALRVL